MKYYLKALRNYVTFTGRATRSEFWFFFLFNVIFSIAASILDSIFGTKYTIFTYESVIGPLPVQFGYMQSAYGLFALIPGLALAVRRMHDVGKSGWFLLISLIPLVGAIWLLVLYCTDSQPRDNEYGPNPKAVGEVIEG